MTLTYVKTVGDETGFIVCDVLKFSIKLTFMDPCIMIN
jgi:hypothetical protein